MKLELKNFRKIEKLSIEFKDGEMTLLNGKNKAGKSTILNAISWILYGDSKRVFPKSKPKAKVEGRLHINRIIITRTANPGSLELKIGKLTFVEDEAREYIDENFGKLNLWKVSCCVENNDINNFLLSTNTQRLDLLNSIAFGDSNPKDRIEKIEEEIKQVKIEIKTKEDLVDTRRKDYEKIKDDEFDIKHCREEEQLIDIENEITQLKKVIPKLREEWKNYQISLGEFNMKQKEKSRLNTELEELKGRVPVKPKGITTTTSNELYEAFMKSVNNETYKKRVKELNKLVKDSKIYKNDEKLLRETGARLEMIQIETLKCQSIPYTREAIDKRINELEQVIKDNEIKKQVQEYNKIKTELQNYYSYKYLELEKARIYDIYEELDKYDEIMEKVDVLMNILRRDKAKYEKLKCGDRKANIMKLKKLEQQMSLHENYEKRKKYEDFVNYRDYLKHSNLLELIADNPRPSKTVKLFNLDKIKQIEAEKKEITEIKNKIMKKKYKLKDIEESLATYECPNCDTKLYLNQDQGKLQLANTVRKYNKTDLEDAKRELEQLNDTLNQYEHYPDDIDDLYLKYYYNELDNLKGNSNFKSVTVTPGATRKPAGYSEDLISELEPYKNVKGQAAENIKEIESEVAYLHHELGDISEDDDVECEGLENISQDDVMNMLKRINDILNRSSISMDDVEVIKVDPNLTIEDIENDIDLLENCRKYLVIMDELEEELQVNGETSVRPNTRPNVPKNVKKELEKIKDMNIEFIKNPKRITINNADDLYIEMKHIEKQLNDANITLDDETEDRPIDNSQLITELNNLKSVVVYEQPEYNYEELERSINARKYTNEIKELKAKIKETDTDEDTEQLKKKYENVKKYEDQMKMYEKEYHSLQERLKEEIIEPTVPKYNLTEKDKRLDALLSELKLATKCNAINKVYKLLQESEDELEELDEILKDLIRLKDIAIGTQCEMLDMLVDRINKQVNMLLDKLLDSPLIFEIKLYRELKTKNVAKQSVNIRIVDGMHEFDNINDLCGGEKSMICVALTLVFNSMCQTPIIMFDETFAKMADEWKEEAIDKIIQNSMGKTVICTIHGGNKGRYDNIIDIPNENMNYIEDNLV